MFNRRKWVAVIRGEKWIVAKISRNKLKLKIHHLAEFDGEAPYLKHVKDSEEDNNVTEVAKQSEEEQVSADLRVWLKKQKVPLKKLDLAISCPGVITRMITLPVLSDKDLEKLLTEQVDQYFTLNISEYVVDYRVLEKIEEDGQQRLRILLVAIPRGQWERQWKQWSELGFSPKVTDFAADTLARLYSKVSKQGERKKSPVQLEKLQDIAIVDVGVGRVEFILLEHGVFFLYSDMEIQLDGLIEYANTLDRGDKSSEPQSEEAAVDHLVSELGQLELAEIGFKNEMEDQLNPVFNTLIEFLNFFATRHYGKSVDFIYITGECSDLPYIAEIFEKNMEIETRVGFPKDWRPYFGRKLSRLKKTWMKYGSLYGLAIRED